MFQKDQGWKHTRNHHQTVCQMDPKSGYSSVAAKRYFQRGPWSLLTKRLLGSACFDIPVIRCFERRSQDWNWPHRLRNRLRAPGQDNKLLHPFRMNLLNWSIQRSRKLTSGGGTSIRSLSHWIVKAAQTQWPILSRSTASLCDTMEKQGICSPLQWHWRLFGSTTRLDCDPKHDDDAMLPSAFDPNEEPIYGNL